MAVLGEASVLRVKRPFLGFAMQPLAWSTPDQDLADKVITACTLPCTVTVAKWTTWHALQTQPTATAMVDAYVHVPCQEGSCI